MDANSWNILSGITAAIPFIILLLKHFATEYVTNFTKELFNTRTKKKTDAAVNRTIYFLFAIAALVFLTPKVAPSLVTHQTTVIHKTEPKKSDTQVVSEQMHKAYNETKQMIEASQEKKRLAIENREKNFVFQIGNSIADDDAIVTLYKKLLLAPAIDPSLISLFKTSRREYFFFYNDEQSKEQLESIIKEFRAKVHFIEPDVQIIDLNSYCKLKESFTQVKSFKVRKEKVNIPCFECR